MVENSFERVLVYPTAAAVLATVFLSLPAQAAHPGITPTPGRLSTSAGGFGTGPYWQGEPTERLPTWRYGFGIKSCAIH
jgi:hypothetical protein